MEELGQPMLSATQFLLSGFTVLFVIGLIAEHIERIQDKKTHQHEASEYTNTHTYSNKRFK